MNRQVHLLEEIHHSHSKTREQNVKLGQTWNHLVQNEKTKQVALINGFLGLIAKMKAKPGDQRRGGKCHSTFNVKNFRSTGLNQRRSKKRWVV